MVNPTRRRSTLDWRLPASIALLGNLAIAATARPAPTGAGECVGGATRLCLGERFEVEATWQDESGRAHAALAVPLGAGRTGAFAFLDGASADLLVRVGAGGSESAFEAVGLTGAAYAVNVLDRSTGARWTRIVAGEPGDAFARVEGVVAHGEAAVGALRYAGEDAGCGETAHTRCLLGGRFAARVTLNGPDASPRRAWAVGSAGETALFASTEGGAPEVALRMIDARTANGHYALLSGALPGTEVEIEIVDRLTGNARRFDQPDGGAAGTIELEALSATATVVHAEPDAARAVTSAIGPLGGTLQAVDAHGTTFRLVLPKNALLSMQDVTLTPVSTLGGLPFSGGLAGAVQVDPAGIVLAASAQLTVTPSPALARAQQLTFAFRGPTGELALAAPIAGAAAIVLPVHRFGGYGVAGGTAAELAAQLARQPTRLEDRLGQRLAGIVLPLRRGTNGAALPATVLQLLQQDYTASIKPFVLKLKQGNLESGYPVVRNWLNTAKDTGQSAKLPTQLKEIEAAEIAGGVASFNAAATSALSGDATAEAAARPCRSIAAAERLFRAYMLLQSRGKQGLVAKQKLQNCALFTVKWNTILDWRPPGPQTHQDVEVSVALPWDEKTGAFWFIKEAKVNAETITQPECNAYFNLEKVGDAVKSDVRFELRLPRFSWSDDLLSALSPWPSVYYAFKPDAEQNWLVTCTQSYPPLPPVGPITAAFVTSWSGNYGSFHYLDAEGHGFRAVLGKSASPSVLAERLYSKGSELLYFEEHTLISVFFTPK